MRLQVVAKESERELLERLCHGDEAAFLDLVEQLEAAMRRMARLYTTDAATIEDAVQDTWIGVLQGICRFEGRSTVRTWVLRILLNRLRTRLRRDDRMIPFSQLFDARSAAPEPAVPADRFLDASHPRWPYHWKDAPQPWGDTPEQRLLTSEARALLEQAVAALPPAQREVITLRDIEGWEAGEVCDLLKLTSVNQRVLLHRARGRVRQALEQYFTEE